MGHDIVSGTVLIRENSILPDGLRLEYSPCEPGWAVVTNFDVRGLDHEIQKAGWTFFCVAGEARGSAFGIDPQKTLRRAIERILERVPATQLNTLEITRAIFAGSERFPLVLNASIWAQWRHIQQGLIFLNTAQVSQSPLRQNEIRRESLPLAIGQTSRRLIA